MGIWQPRLVNICLHQDALSLARTRAKRPRNSKPIMPSVTGVVAICGHRLASLTLLRRVLLIFRWTGHPLTGHS